MISVITMDSTHWFPIRLPRLHYFTPCHSLTRWPTDRFIIFGITDIRRYSHLANSFWLVAYWATGHFLNQCWFVINWTPADIYQWNWKHNRARFIGKRMWKCDLQNEGHFVPKLSARCQCMGRKVRGLQSARTHAKCADPRKVRGPMQRTRAAFWVRGALSAQIRAKCVGRGSIAWAALSAWAAIARSGEWAALSTHLPRTCRAMPTQWHRGSTHVGRNEPQSSGTLRVNLLSGVPDYFDRNKILSGYDLSHYQVPHCIKSFLWFCLICVYSSQFSILFSIMYLL